MSQPHGSHIHDGFSHHTIEKTQVESDRVAGLHSDNPKAVNAGADAQELGGDTSIPTEATNRNSSEAS